MLFCSSGALQDEQEKPDVKEPIQNYMNPAKRDPGLQSSEDNSSISKGSNKEILFINIVFGFRTSIFLKINIVCMSITM